MKKNIFVFILFQLFLLSVSCEKNKSIDIIYNSKKYQNKTEITFSEMQEDLETFIYLVETSYIGYDAALERGLDTNVSRQFVLEQFDNQKKIQIQDFADVLYDAFAGYIQDNHALINYFNNNFGKSFIKKGYLYFSDVYVQKNEDKYFVCESKLLEIKPGAQYNSDVEYLLLYPAKGKNVYRIGCVSEKDPDGLHLEFDNQFYDVPIKMCQEANGNEQFSYFVLETEKSIYVKLNRCTFDNDKELEALHQFAESYKSCMNKDFVIVDVRGNYGGDDTYFLHFLCGLYNDNKRDVFFGTGTRWLYSAANVKSMKTLLPIYADVNNPEIKKMLEELSEYEKQVQKSSQKIIVKNDSQKTPLVEPEFKGKLIFLTDKIAASAGEDGIAYGTALFGETDQIIQVGQNTSGAQLYGNLCQYVLENSGIQVRFSMTDFSAVPKLSHNFKGEGFGYFPDYWSSNEDMNDTIFAITGDKQMHEVLSNIF